MIQNVKVYKPRLEVEFHTPSRMYRAVKTPTNDMDGALRSDILVANTTKMLRTPAGSFTLTLTGRRGPDGLTWFDRLNPMDLVVIRMQRFNPADPNGSDSAMQTIMVGLIDVVEESESVDGQSGAHRVIVQGRDFGKIFLKAIQHFFPTDPDSILKKEDVLIKQRGPNGAPAYLIAWAITELIFKDLMALNFTLYNGTGPVTVALPSILRFVLASTPELVPFTTGLFSFDGPVWNFMTNIVNEPFNELFIDTRSDFMESVNSFAQVEHSSGDSAYGLPGAIDFGNGTKVVTILRPTPFDAEAWNAIPRHTVTRNEVISYGLSKSDNEVYTAFYVNPVLKVPTDTDWKNLVKPLKASEDRRKKFGLNVMEVSIRALDTAQQEITNAIQYGQALQKKLQDWYGQNETLESGSLVLQGNGKYHIGQRVDLDWRKKGYYVEGVTQDFPLFGEFKTTLALTRGH